MASRNMTNKKPTTRTFEVRLARTQTWYKRVEVRARDKREAAAKALGQAGDLDFHEGTAGEPEYGVDEINEQVARTSQEDEHEPEIDPENQRQGRD